MKVLATIPHYYKVGGDTRYGSGRQDPRLRSHQLLRTLLHLHQHFGSGACQLDIGKKEAHRLDLNRSLEIAICVHEDDHLLKNLSQHTSLFRVISVKGNPKHLGFACHKVLGDSPGFDRYIYLEDDLLIHDPAYFEKLKHVEASLGPWALLQPNRFERGHHPLSKKCYVDGPLREGALDLYRDSSRPDTAALDWGYSKIHLEKAKNPHSGTFSLSQTQWDLWKSSPHFMGMDVSFVGPLESAASLSVMKTFEIFKTIPEDAHHFEIEHQAQGFLSQVIQGRIPLKKSST